MKKLYTLLPNQSSLRWVTMVRLTVKARDGKRKVMTPTSAREMLERWRWNGEPVCPRCSSTHPIYERHLPGYFRCPNCKQDFTVRTGTVMERSHVQLDKWIYASYVWNRSFHELSGTRRRYSSAKLSREIGVTQKTAWFLLLKLWKSFRDNQSQFLFEIGRQLYFTVSAKEQQRGRS